MRTSLLLRSSGWAALSAVALLALSVPAHAQDGDPEMIDDENQWVSAPPPPPEADYDGDGDADGDDAQYAAQMQAPQQPQAAPTLQSFQAALSPYGAWIQVSGLGLVWQPYTAVVGADFVPYQSGGSWAYTPAGWEFRTRWGWGWAPFHYGRWHYASSIGWVWWPSYRWAPAWVDWRRCDSGYVAWAPLAPPGLQINFGFNRVGWSYAPHRYLARPMISRFVVRPSPWRNRWAWSEPRHNTWYRSPWRQYGGSHFGQRRDPSWGSHQASGVWGNRQRYDGNWSRSIPAPAPQPQPNRGWNGRGGGWGHQANAPSSGGGWGRPSNGGGGSWGRPSNGGGWGHSASAPPPGNSGQRGGWGGSGGGNRGNGNGGNWSGGGHGRH